MVANVAGNRIGMMSTIKCCVSVVVSSVSNVSDKFAETLSHSKDQNKLIGYFGVAMLLHAESLAAW